jgi:hypothetical protein
MNLFSATWRLAFSPKRRGGPSLTEGRVGCRKGNPHLRAPLAVVLAMTAGFGRPAMAQNAPDRPALTTFRYDEDWSVMRDPVRRTGLLDRLKWIPLTEDGSWFLTLGGESRTRYESSRNPVFGLSAPARNDYLLQRSLLFADVHFGPNVRAFLELGGAYAPGWNGTPPATQRNPIDIQQGFGDVSVPLGGGEMVLRVGRQEMAFGSSRLVSVRESPNVRRAFDGVRVSWSNSPQFRADAFLVRPVVPQAGNFNDSNDPAQAFWGLYTTTEIQAVPGLKLDLYYLGLERENARFTQGVGTERRHTMGARLFGRRSGFDWNLEAAYQFGSFGSADIRAWTVSSNLGYVMPSWPLAPRFALNADAISGDRNPHDRVLGTFNPLFPRLPYFSEANLVAPANLLDLQPNLTLTPARGVSFNIGWNPFWKQERADAFYAPPLSAVRGTAASRGRFIGQQVSTLVEWKATERVTLAATYVHYEPGELTRQAGGRAGDFAAAWVQLRF